jgi:hypothetical protein
LHDTISVPILKRALILHRLSHFVDVLVAGRDVSNARESEAGDLGCALRRSVSIETAVFNGPSARDEAGEPVLA